MKKFDEFINERYKEPTSYTKNEFGWDVADRTYVDDVFDHLLQIVCDVNHVSEKDFKGLDQTKDYVEKYFDNNQEILQIIDEYKDKRYQFCAEVLYDKLFTSKSEGDSDSIETRLPKPEDDVELIVQSEKRNIKL